MRVFYKYITAKKIQNTFKNTNKSAKNRKRSNSCEHLKCKVPAFNIANKLH